VHHSDRRQLVKLIVHHYGSYDELRVFLDGIGQSLAVIAPPGPLEQVVNDVVGMADRRGWLAHLTREIANDLSHVDELRRLAELAGNDRPPDFSAADLALYDLAEIETSFREARLNADGTLVGAAISCADETFRKYLFRRLGRLVGAEPREAVTLDPSMCPIDRTVAKVTGLRRSLRWRPQLVPVCADRLPDAPQLVADFWERLTTEELGQDHELVVVFTMPPGTTVPAGVTRLPNPLVQDGHIAEWVDHVADALGWPAASPRRKRLVRLICAQVNAADEALRLYTLYSELDYRLSELQYDLDSVIAALDAA
jgi:hypothetical protein